MARAKPKVKEPNPIAYALKSISFVSKHIYESAITDFSNTSDIKYDHSGRAVLDVDNKLIQTLVFFKFYHKDNPLFEFEIENTFSLPKANQQGMVKAYETEKFIRHLFTISVHHARGAQSQLLENTPYQDLYIPLNTSFILEKEKVLDSPK